MPVKALDALSHATRLKKTQKKQGAKAKNNPHKIMKKLEFPCSS